MNAILTKHLHRAPANPVTGQTWTDASSNKLHIFVGDKWINVEDPQGPRFDNINNIGYAKANAILGQTFRDEVIRQRSKATQKAWEKYQLVLQMNYDVDDINEYRIDREIMDDKE